MTMIDIHFDDLPQQSDGAGAQDVAFAETAVMAPLGLIGSADAAACTDAACLPADAAR